LEGEDAAAWLALGCGIAVETSGWSDFEQPAAVKR
jgi:hypothetical protein